MRMRWRIGIGLGIVVGIGVSVAIAAQGSKQLKQAKKLLEKIKQVDGSGSGLDADTVQGMTPSALKASITPPTPGETLSALQQVDGAGSGLDADTLRGLTPAQIAANAGQNGGGFQVVNAGGRLVGPLVGTDFVALAVNGVLVLFPVVRDRVGQRNDIPFYYESTDCSGPAFMSAGLGFQAAEVELL